MATIDLAERMDMLEPLLEEARPTIRASVLNPDPRAKRARRGSSGTSGPPGAFQADQMRTTYAEKARHAATLTEMAMLAVELEDLAEHDPNANPIVMEYERGQLMDGRYIIRTVQVLLDNLRSEAWSATWDRAVEMRLDGATWEAIEAETGLPHSKVERVLKGGRLGRWGPASR